MRYIYLGPSSLNVSQWDGPGPDQLLLADTFDAEIILQRMTPEGTMERLPLGTIKELVERTRRERQAAEDALLADGGTN